MGLTPFQRRVAKALEPFGDAVEIKPSLVNVFVTAGDWDVAEVSERAYRILPGTRWLPLRPIALRNDVAAALNVGQRHRHRNASDHARHRRS